MAATTKEQIKLVFEYEYGSAPYTFTHTRRYKEAGYDKDEMKDRVIDFNENVPDYFAQTFISDEYDNFVSISSAQYITTTEEVVFSYSQ